jgi:adenylyltransferase/sulfurtransferase
MSFQDTSTPSLDAAELLRYSRHLVLPQVGLDGQQRLKAARVLLVGAGGLGSPLALYLAAAGVGTLGLVDFDVVDLSNLQRQVLYGTGDVGRAKLAAAAERIRTTNPHVHVETFDTRLTSTNALEIIDEFDIVADGTDNFATRYLVNDACVLLGKPNVFGSVFRFDGQASVFATADGPCYRCLYPEPPPSGLVPDCAEGGVLGVLPGLIGTIQAIETLKLALRIGTTLAGRLLLVDALRLRFRTVEVRRDPRCPACGTREIRELIDYEQFCGQAGSGVVGADVPEIWPRELAARLAAGDPIALIDVREPHERAIARIEGSIHVPMSSLDTLLPSFDPTREIVVLCKGGARSAQAVRRMRQAGFTNVRNLAGGIDRWSVDVDPDVPRY